MSAPFDPAAWLAAFCAVGGGYTVRDKLMLFLCVRGRNDDELWRARQMIDDLSPDQEAAIVVHLQCQALAVYRER